MKPLITVILPVYKVEKYLRRAIDSVTRQTYKNLEIILVDDGSPDGCGCICEECALLDKRIKVIHKENGGLSDARNTGIASARGEYIAFVDSDDYIAPRFMELLYEALVDTNSDVALCKYVETICDDVFKERQEIGKRTEYSGREMSLNMYADINQDFTCFVVAWNKLYKRSLWQEVRFPKGKIHEDEATTYQVYDKVLKGVFVQATLYAYYQSDTSITGKPFSESRLDCLSALEGRIEFYKQKKDSELVARTYKTLADTAIVDYRIICKENSWSFSEQEKNKVLLRKYVRNTIKGVKCYGGLPFRTMVGYRIFLVTPTLYYFLLTK